ncbi:Thioredoxin F, chloroplastic [Dichanthelium oligosanthes]|uniref:Thioredoxin F, chloroplastic n=1 Tax=Dichanthelium oligosanthes TaxID=888268 RepID=A0A1E5W5S7_9POAL|nr:Thioredoxin F, chloroplastic [Dichanthelium oligosanthes]
MALRLSISPHGPASSTAISTCRPAACGRFPALVGGSAASQKRSLMTGSEMRGVTAVRSGSLETTSVGAEAVTGQVTEVTKDSFWPIVKAAGDKVVVLDMYTQWCGPCKVMAPKFQEMSEKNLDVVFLKLDCNQDNRPLAKELGIKVVPTFKILKDGKVVKEVTGAKIDELAHAIETVKSS